MKNKFKYMRRVFSGKDIPVTGIDQGKSALYRGRGVEFMLNGFYETSMEFREGQLLDETFDSGINTAGRLSSNRFIGEGTNLRVEAI